MMDVLATALGYGFMVTGTVVLATWLVHWYADRWWKRLPFYLKVAWIKLLSSKRWRAELARTQAENRSLRDHRGP